jgi:prenyltransferase beta subunit
MQIKKTLVLIGVISVVFLSCFIAVSNKSVAIPGGENYGRLEFPKSSDATNLEIINTIFDSKNSDYSSSGYYPQIYSSSLQATYYALSVLEAIDRIDEIDQQKAIDYVISFYNSSSHQFLDENALRYLASEIPRRYLPLSTLLEINCYAVLSLSILNSLNRIDTTEIIDFIWDCYHPNLHGFIGQPYDSSLDEGFKIPTADNTYYAVIALDLLGIDWNQYSQERSDIISYIENLQSLSSDTGFYNDYEPMFDSLMEPEPNMFASYYCIKTLETLGSAYVDVIDKNKFYQDLSSLYHSDEFYFDISSTVWVNNYSNIVATAINLELSDITGFTNFDRNEVVNFMLNNRVYRGGWEASTTIKYHELIDTFQIVRSLSNVGAISELIMSEKDEIESFVGLFSQERGFSLISEDYTSVDLIYAVVTSYEHFDRLGELSIQELYDLLEGTVKESDGNYRFFACTNLDLSKLSFRSKPYDYYSTGYHKYVEEMNSISSNKDIFKTLGALDKIFKLNDFASSYNLYTVLQAIIDSQFLDPLYTKNFGAFLINNVNYSSERKNDLIYLKYSYYALKAMELIADFFSLGSITGVYFSDLGFDRAALATYIVRNIIETPTELYFEVDYSDSVELALENLYFSIYILEALNQFSLDVNKIENFVLNNLNYSNVKNLYYCYKISEILDLNITFDVEQTHSLIQNIYSDIYDEFYATTEREFLEQETFLWVCEMAKNDQVRINARYSNSITLGGSNVFSVDLVNLILSDFGQYTTVKLESIQLGTFVFDQMTNRTHQKEIHIPVDPNNYPVVIGELCVYDGSTKVAQLPISFNTTFDTIYGISISKTESRIDVIVNASLRFASGEQPVFDGSMYADIYRGGDYIDTVFLTSENELQSTLFRFVYRPSYNGIYYFELYLDDTYHLSSQFVLDTSFTYTGAGPIPGEQSIDGFENDALITFPLIIAMIGAASGAVITTSKTKYFKKAKNKLKTIVK